MLELLLLRHAKSRWDEPGVADHDRDLAPRGVSAAGQMGRLLRERGLVPDLVLCSTARRAERTWQLAADALGVAPAIRHEARLYLADPERLLGLVREFGGSARRLLAVGHNPGLHEFALALRGCGDAAGSAALAAKLPTGGLVLLGFDCGEWAQVDWRGGTLRGYWWPRGLTGSAP